MKIKITLFYLFCYITTMLAASGGPDPVITARIKTILEKVPPGTQYGILAIEPLSADTIYAANVSHLLVPASVTKLFTTLTAINRLGPDFELSTILLSDDKNISDGVINGNLYIKGYGHSLFTGDSLRKLVFHLKELGITNVTGKIIGDDSYFDQEYFRKDWIEGESSGDIMPPISALVLDRNMVTVKKQIRRRRFRYVSEIVRNPATNAASRLKGELLNSGIEVGGEAGTGAAPKHCILLGKSTVTLRHLISVINKRSDNFLAECLFKTVGAEFGRKQGTGFLASQAVNSFLEKHDIITDKLDVVDGSGLSRNNLVSARSVVSLLEWAYLNLPAYDDFHQSLSHASRDGTLRGRLYNLPGGAVFRGKTGTLRGHITLAGYLKCASGDELIIAILFDYDRQSPRFYRSVEDEIVKALAEYRK